MITLLSLLILALSNLACVYITAKVLKKEAFFNKPIDGELTEAPDFVGREPEYEG